MTDQDVIKTIQGKYGTIRLLRPVKATTKEDIHDLVKTLTNISISAYVSKTVR